MGKMVPACRFLRMQESIIRSNNLATPRMRESVSYALNTSVLIANSMEIIKGLFLTPTQEVDSCIHAQPLIIFGKPHFASHRGDFQHMDLARTLGVLTFEEKDFCGEKMREPALPKGIWGFAMIPLEFSFSSLYPNPYVSRSMEDNRQIVVRMAERDFKRSETLFHLANKFYESFWRESSYGFAFLEREGVFSVFEIRASSGLGGAIPKDALPAFYSALARHISPDYKVLTFIPDDEKRPYILLHDLQSNQEPNCLLWGPEF